MKRFLPDRTSRRSSAAAPTRPWSALPLGILLLVAATAAEAHRSGAEMNNADARGLEISAIAHSDMAFVAPYYGAIIALAERQTRTDERFRRLLNYTRIQKTYCLWGLVPGAITNEESSFNRCSHAYLAGTWALLEHLATKPEAHAQAARIVASIENDRSAALAFVLCQSSAETFHTGEFIVPVQPTVAAGWLVSIGLAGGMTAAFGRRAVSKARNRSRS